MTAWQAMFLPRRLMEYLRTAHVADGSGQMPLVTREQELNRSSHFVDPDSPGRTWIPLLLTGLLAGTLLASLGAAAGHRAQHGAGSRSSAPHGHFSRGSSACSSWGSGSSRITGRRAATKMSFS
jgi:hypothetical protein